MKMKEHVLLSEFSNYKIGGPAQLFFAAKNEEEVRWAVTEAKAKKMPIFVLGGGTNLLIGDEGWNGLVLKLSIDFIKKEKDGVSVGAGTSIAKLLNYSITHSLSGCEWAGGLPGTVGGAIRGNAGCFGGEMKDAIESVRSFDMETLRVVERNAKECAFAYRDSIFKSACGQEVILSAVIRLKKGNKKEIKKAIAEKIAYRKKNHPLEYPNIGSIFKNVPLESVSGKKSAEYKAALAVGKLGYKGSEFTIKTDPFPVISSAKLISESGLRGVSFGGAMISPKHPNFIVNMLNAQAGDVKNLIALAKVEVHKKFGVELEEEVQIL